MALSTDTSWEINGVPLQTYGYNVTTWGGDLQSPPPLRGSDTTIPYVPGTLFQERIPDGRPYTFDMWVVGANEDGLVPTGSASRAEFEKNLKALRNLFFNQARQITITKKWREYGSSTILTATAKAIYVQGFAPVMNGSTRATFAVELYLSDPFFSGAQQTLNFPGVAASTWSGVILGDYPSTDIVLDMVGVRNNFRFTNVTESLYVNVSENVSSVAQSVSLDVQAWTAIKNTSGTPSNVIAKVTQFGHKFWFMVRPGAQSLSLSASSSSGTMTGMLKYRPKWI